MTSTTTDLLASYTRLADPFGAVVDRVTAPRWDAPSPCEGWSARDVLAHVVTTQCDFLQRHGVDATTPADGARPDDPHRTWHAHDDRIRQLLADPSVADIEYDGVFGRTTVGASIVTFYGFDLVVHRWDIAVAAGLDERLTDDELDLVDGSADGFGDHLYDEGVCRPALAIAHDADRQERVLARLGRRAREWAV